MIRMRRSARIVGAVLVAGSIILAFPLYAAGKSPDVIAGTPHPSLMTLSGHAAPSPGAASGTSPDEIHCRIGAAVAVNQRRIYVPNILTVHGRDFATTNGACADTNVLDAQNFAAFLDITYQYLAPGTQGYWLSYAVGGCTRSSTQSAAVFVDCSAAHEFADPNDPIQDRCRRTVFTLGIFVNGQKHVRDTREVGPFPPCDLPASQ